jgi:hypothetical protein
LSLLRSNAAKLNIKIKWNTIPGHSLPLSSKI